VRREQSLEGALRDSSERLQAWLASEEAPPDVQAQARENLDRLARALAELPDGQREVVVWRHCHGWSLSAIAQHSGRSTAAVAGLLHRGLVSLRERLHEKG